MELTGVRVVVVGLGKSGLSAFRFLKERGALATLTDTRPRDQWPPSGHDQPAVPVDILDLSQFKLMVLSPGVAIDDPLANRARKLGAKVIGEVELAAPFLKGRSIGITGSNGKTTTTAMIGHILSHAGIFCQVGGNIGVPPTGMVAASRDGQWNVLELSSFQLETISGFAAQIAVVVNITPDHLDRHHDFATYVAAKRRLMETQTRDAFAVLNADDPECVEFAKATQGTPFWFSAKGELPAGMWQHQSGLWLNGAKLMDSCSLPLPGQHNIQNALAAASACHLAGTAPHLIAEALSTFPGVEHRIEFTRELRGVRYYNDSKATNVDAAEKALDAFPGGLWVILGGKDKGSDYKPLRNPLRSKARAALLIGSAADKIANEIEGSAPIVRCETLERAVSHASRRAEPGDIVLLAPACASFDQFENYEHRGRVFKQLVRSLEE